MGFIQDVQGNRYRLETRSHYESIQIELTRFDDETGEQLPGEPMKVSGNLMSQKVLVNVDTGEEVTDTLDLGTHWLMRGENGAYIYTPKDKV